MDLIHESFGRKLKYAPIATRFVYEIVIQQFSDSIPSQGSRRA